MTYLQNITAEQTVRIPRLGAGITSGPVAVQLVSTVGNDAVLDADGITPDLTRTMLSLPLSLPTSLPDGEYVLTVSQDDAVIYTGLLQVGDYEHIPAPMSGGGIKFEQYDGK